MYHHSTNSDFTGIDLLQPKPDRDFHCAWAECPCMFARVAQWVTRWFFHLAFHSNLLIVGPDCGFWKLFALRTVYFKVEFHIITFNIQSLLVMADDDYKETKPNVADAAGGDGDFIKLRYAGFLRLSWTMYKHTSLLLPGLPVRMVLKWISKWRRLPPWAR